VTGWSPVRDYSTPFGKSRFLYEFRHQVRHQPLTFLAGRCVSYGQASPYLPLLNLLRQACGLTDSDTPVETAARVAQYLQAVGMESEAWGPYVLRVLGRDGGTEPMPPLGPQALRTRIFEALIQMQLNASHQRPLLLEVEDVHWIDPTSEEWLMALVERLAGVPILLLLSYRSEYHPAWIGKCYATQLALQRLTAHESQRVVRAVLSPQAVPDRLVRAIVAKGQGNPFFLEELAQTAVEQGAQHPTLVIPETVQAVLAARLDRLPPEAKALLQVAAVIGTEVPGTLLQVVTACSEATLRPNLHDAHHRPLPLVLHLHGSAPLPNIADLELHARGYLGLPGKFKVIVAAPTGTAGPVVPNFRWNITEGCCAFPSGTEPDDVGFLNRLLDELLARYPVDPQRAYIYGYSAGAAMAYRLACDSTDRFAAIASGAGQFPVHDSERCAPSAPISILEVHSLDDEVVPFDGGTFPLNPALALPGAIELVEYWAAHNGCKGILTFGKKPKFDLTTIVEGKETTVNKFKQCPNGIDVELWSMEGVPHPPLFFRVGPDGIKTLAEKTWKFLRQHARDHHEHDDDDEE